MKIIKKNVQFLTNTEAKNLLEKLGDLDESVMRYCTNDMAYDKIEIKKAELKEIGLYEFEIIQLLNLLPKQILDLQLVIEEMEERFDEFSLDKILNIFQD
ncbi:hypothetical protein NGRA_0504 [Nosema granulosis]|uniref:Uncharacterized protein n=1 Tax=Nosema granulosis TaxID=83296 RepID=A0A9P6L032_9MICR|nr:hypothetical protein NGRA_0504 [Nosema granulosis]